MAFVKPRSIPGLVFGMALMVMFGVGAVAESPAPHSVAGAENLVDGAAKTATAGSRLLLPWFEVDTNDPNGITTLFAVRNEGTTATDIEIAYHQTDVPQDPQVLDPVRLGPKEIKTVNIRLVPGLSSDAEGFIRGYVLITSTDGGSLAGDTFQITPGDNFANGSRLLNVGPESPNNELCNLFSIRFLNGGGFDSGTVYSIWVDLPLAPDGTDPVLDALAYDQAGNLLIAREIFADQVAFQISANDVLSPVNENFGAIEIQFRDGAVGTLGATLDASGRYSVGFAATCGDP